MNSEIKIQYKVIDNFLPKENFLVIKEMLSGDNFPWYYIPTIVDCTKPSPGPLFYMMHLLYNYDHAAGGTSVYFDTIKNNLLKFIDIKALIRVKANLNPNQNIKRMNGPHVDYPFAHKGAIFSVNTCNGGTLLKDGTKIDSVENRILFFDPSLEHDVELCTDQKVRVNININYF